MTESEFGYQPQEPEPQAPIEEIDLRGLDLPALQEKLTEQIKAGHVLHGSPKNGLTTLHPALSGNAFDEGGPIEAVFATDQPLIAAACAVIGEQTGQRVEGWMQQVLFTIPNPYEPYKSEGYIYVLPKESFLPNVNDPSEYLSGEPVRPTARMIFDSAAITPLFRSTQELTDTIIDGQLNSEKINPNDVTASLLVLRHMFTLVGFLDEYSTMNSDQGDRLDRIPRVIKTLQPVLSRFKDLAIDEQKHLAQELQKIYWYMTYSVPSSWDMMLLDKVDEIDPAMRRLEQDLKAIA